jgi:uncharacterized protein YdhG (YjbR/CyaY superfamily)
MKKATSARRRSVSRRNATDITVDEYFDRLSEAGRHPLNKMRAVIRATVPRDATDIISDRMPAVEHNGVLVWYGAFRGHCSLFPTASVVEALKDELAGFKTSKGTIQFPADKPLPIALIRRIVRTRVEQHEAKRRG